MKNMLADWKHRLDVCLDGQEPEMLALLERLVNMDTFTTDGDDVTRMGEVIAGWMRDAGFDAAKIAKFPVPEEEQWQEKLGHAFVAGSHDKTHGPGIGFIGHMDTVFPAGTAASRPFAINGDIARGPGVADMKAGLVANMFAARALKQLGVMPCPMTLVFSPDEELGSPTGAKALRQALTGAKAVINAEPGGPGGKVTRSRKGSGHMLLSVKGKSAHAGRNYAEGASAILELAHKVLAIDKLLDLDRSLTVNTGIIEGGTSANSVAPHAEARIHLTYLTLEEGEAVVKTIKEIVGRPVVRGTTSCVSGGLRLLPLERTARNDRLFELVVDAGHLLGMTIEGQHYDSAAESGFCSSGLGVPTICNMGPEGDNIHSPDEYLVVSSIVTRTKLIALTALQAATVF